MNQISSHRYAVVVAGGSGTRLWPISRQDLPKQMQKFVNDRTLIDETVDRLTDVFPLENIYISTTANYAERMKELVPNVPVENIIVEPTTRGTAAAFSLFAATIYERDPEAIIFSLASDHAITGVKEFHSAIKQSLDFVEKSPGSIALIGIKPTEPDTGMGYVKINEPIQQKPLAWSVEKFIEKPSLKVAQTYVSTEEYYWNAAYYCFTAQTLLAAYNEADPNLIKWVTKYMKSGKLEHYRNIPVKAQEIEVINSNKYPLVLIPGDFQWSDIGNWQSLHALLIGLENGHVVQQGGEHVDVDSTNSLVMSTDHRLIATVGLDNIAIVSTKDALLVLDKEHTQDVKELLNLLKSKGLDKYL